MFIERSCPAEGSRVLYNIVMATHEAEATEDMRLTILVLAADMLSAYPRYFSLHNCSTAAH